MLVGPFDTPAERHDDVTRSIDNSRAQVDALEKLAEVMAIETKFERSMERMGHDGRLAVMHGHVKEVGRRLGRRLRTTVQMAQSHAQVAPRRTSPEAIEISDSEDDKATAILGGTPRVANRGQSSSRNTTILRQSRLNPPLSATAGQRRLGAVRSERGPERTHGGQSKKIPPSLSNNELRRLEAWKVANGAPRSDWERARAPIPSLHCMTSKVLRRA